MAVAAVVLVGLEQRTLVGQEMVALESLALFQAIPYGTLLVEAAPAMVDPNTEERFV